MGALRGFVQGCPPDPPFPRCPFSFPCEQPGTLSNHPKARVRSGCQPAPSPENLPRSSPTAASSPRPDPGPGLSLILGAAAAVAHQGRRTHGGPPSLGHSRPASSRNTPGIPLRRKCSPGGGARISTASGRGLGRGPAGLEPRGYPPRLRLLARRALTTTWSLSEPPSSVCPLNRSLSAVTSLAAARSAAARDLPAADGPWVRGQLIIPIGV